MNAGTGSAGLTSSYYPADPGEAVSEMTVGELLTARASDAGELTALVEIAPPASRSLAGAVRTDRSWTYARLHAEAKQCAQWLLTHFQPGDRLTVWAPNIPEWVILQYGAAMAGLVLVTANPALRSDELRYVLAQSRSAGLVHADQFRGTDMTAIAAAATADLDPPPWVFCFADWDTTVRGWHGPRQPLPTVRPEDPAQIQYTSGTTGAPKGALLHHRGLVTNARYIAVRGSFPDHGTLVSAMPLFHTAGCAMSVLGCAHTSATYALVQLFDPELVLQALHDLHGDVIFGVPTMLIALLNHPSLTTLDFTHCSVAMSGGSSVPPELVRRVETAFGCRFTTVYGQTELSPIVTQTSPADSDTDKASTVGRPLWQVEVKIADPDTATPVPVGKQGEICARGYQQMLGYFDQPHATARTIDTEGWLHTGDLGTMDSRGYVAVTGRLKDMIIRGGENIYPREIEEVLFTHPDVQDVAVVGVPDDTWGEQVAAVIRPRDPAATPAPAALHEFCRTHLAPHKTPTYWYAADEFPLTGSGKVQKYRIVELIAQDSYNTLTDNS